MLDTDGSGFIDREELVRALSKYGDLSDLDSILSQVGGLRCEALACKHAPWPGHARCVGRVLPPEGMCRVRPERALHGCLLGGAADAVRRLVAG